ncbi:MAG TPA: cellulase family glycosylhydrolase [Nitrososphaera sp.]|jgi:hypothetical protein
MEENTSGRKRSSKDLTRLVLGITLSIVLGASVIPASYAADTIRHFDGSNYIEVPNSSDLQLGQFTLEARFRIADNLSERGYIVSKSASDDGNVHLDHNYALYVTKLGKLGGGFKDTDGAYHYIYSDVFAVGAWHIAKLVYDGSELRLYLDGALANSTKLTKMADISDAGPLRIGTNAEKLDTFFIGDLDYVKVMDRSAYKVKYYNTFNTDASPPPPTNKAPVAVNDVYATMKNTGGSLNVLVNDSDPDGDSLTVVSVADSPNGSTASNGNGVVTYTPNTGFVGSDSFSYKISDGTLTDTAIVTVTVSDTPPPPPPTTGDCSDIPMKQLRGVALMDPVLSRSEKGGSSGAADYVEDSMQHLKSYGFNLVRVPYYWESYAYNPTDFMNRLDLIAKTAQEYDICVVFDNHHWFTSSYWNTDIGKSGTAIGFPSFVVKSFPSKPTYYETAGPFWEALLSNTLVIDGKKIWDIQAEFLTKVVNKVDNYDSVAGYEILNEPHLWSKTQYDKLGNYNTYMAQKIRAVSDKKIVFDRETTKEFMRDPTLEYKIVPKGVSKLVYGPHLYSPPTAGGGGDKQLNNIKQWAQEWGVEIMIGEFSAHSQTDMNAFLKAWKDAGFGWTYWKWSRATGTGAGHLGNVVFESDTVAKTEALKQLLAAYNTVY